MQTIKGGDYLSTQEVKEQYGWSRNTLYLRAREHALKPIRLMGDKRYWWSIRELDRMKEKKLDTSDRRNNDDRRGNTGQG